MTPDLLRKFADASGSHTKKYLGFIYMHRVRACRFEMLKLFLLSNELCGSQSRSARCCLPQARQDADSNHDADAWLSFRNLSYACLGSPAMRIKRSSSKNPISISNSNMGARRRGGSIVFRKFRSLQGLPAKARQVPEGSATPVPGRLELT